MAWPPEELVKVAERVHADGPESYTPRELLRWYGYERRGRFIIWAIRNDFAELKIQTEPDIEVAYIDGDLVFQKLVDQPTLKVPPNSHPDETQAILISSPSDDPTHRIGRLPSANSRPVSVNPSSTIAEAVTLMILHDFSQLPVMLGERTLKGAVSWQSIGSRIAIGRTCNIVQDCIEDALVLESSVSLFSAIPTIIERKVSKQVPRRNCAMLPARWR